MNITDQVREAEAAIDVALRIRKIAKITAIDRLMLLPQYMAALAQARAAESLAHISLAMPKEPVKGREWDRLKWIEEHPALYVQMLANSHKPFYRSLLVSLEHYGSLTEAQTASLKRDES